ncbi:MAG: SMI1/KNR4 family protein [Gemmataceae bacterium]
MLTGKVGRVLFTDSYQDTFATLGVPLRSQDASANADIADAEQRLAIKLPSSLREYYLLAGREKRINQFHNRLLPPEKLFIDSGRLVFMEENQCVVYWAVPAAPEVKPDTAVFQGVSRRDKGIEWHTEHDSCFIFLNVMAIWHASFGGAGKHTAIGYVDESTTRVTLDQGWHFVGEANAMRAYKQSERAICFLKWEDFIQKDRQLPAWRVFAVAASEDGLSQLQASLPAHWKERGS